MDQDKIQALLHQHASVEQELERMRTPVTIVFGDVVNAASRVQHQTRADEVLITDVLLDAARTAGFQCAKLGRAEMRGKDELIDLYAVAWSESNTQLIEELQARFENKLKEAK